jgi:hypothetical protein
MDSTSILDVYKVFWYLDMLFMEHPYSDMPLPQVGGGFWGFGGTRPEPE